MNVDQMIRFTVRYHLGRFYGRGNLTEGYLVNFFSQVVRARPSVPMGRLARAAAAFLEAKLEDGWTAD